MPGNILSKTLNRLVSNFSTTSSTMSALQPWMKAWWPPWQVWYFSQQQIRQAAFNRPRLNSNAIYYSSLLRTPCIYSFFRVCYKICCIYKLLLHSGRYKIHLVLIKDEPAYVKYYCKNIAQHRYIWMWISNFHRSCNIIAIRNFLSSYCQFFIISAVILLQYIMQIFSKTQ